MYQVAATAHQNVWFMHDDAPAHVSIAVLSYLHASYPGCWIGQSEPVARVLHFPDLNSLDFFYWGRLYMRRSDEAHFWLNGYVNKQNCHIWSEANPQVYVETPLHPEKLIFWCALWAGGILLQNR
ncbi:hypothetical protein TNCV_918411 [Trichonephila clavipes]|nr:hypothetical protein TNCV_918411 [Trichonephila clavipes]